MQEEYHIGFTGTQAGMTQKQKDAFSKLLGEWLINFPMDTLVLHHGLCIGADEDAHKLFLPLIYPPIERGKIIGHPPIYKGKVMMANPNEFDYMLRERSYLERNQDIVRQSSVLVATPKEKIEQLRSGTWSTIRYARKLNKPVMILEP